MIWDSFSCRKYFPILIWYLCSTTICMIEAGPEFVINVFPSTNFTVKHRMCVVKSYKIFKLALNNYDIKQHVLTVKIHAFGWFFWNVCLAERYITQRLRKHFKLDFERQTVTEKGLPKQLRKMCKSCSLSVSHIHIVFNIQCRAKSLLQVMNISLHSWWFKILHL